MSGKDDLETLLLQAAGGAFPFARPDIVGVAVSGGGDSMALLHLMVRAGAKTGWRVRAATVDHGLRAEAAAEARAVKRACRALGIGHDTLRWRHGPVDGNLQDAARKARYALLSGWAKTRGIGHVALGHTADDQAETFLMNLARSAGLDGLSGMRPRWRDGGIVWSRPLLATTRADLRGWLVREGIEWIDDPSNEDERFSRVRARKVIAALAPLGIGAASVASSVGHLERDRAALGYLVGQEARRLCREFGGEFIFPLAAFRQNPAEVVRRLVLGCLYLVSGAEHPPRGKAVERALEAIRAGRGLTLAGCRVRVTGEDVRFCREAKAVAGAKARPGEAWDGRWRLVGPAKRGQVVRALGAEGLKFCKDWRETGASREALIVSPAVWAGKRLVAAPFAGLDEGWVAEPCRPFAAAFTRH